MRIHPVFCILACYLSSVHSNGQQSVTLPLKQWGRDALFDKSQILLPVFRMKGDSLQGNTFEGTRTAPWFRIRFPEMPGCQDTGYFYLYFNGSACPIQGCIPVIIENPLTPKPFKLHIDYNGNLDFTDDGPGVSLPPNFKYADITLYNHKLTQGRTCVRLSRMSIKGYEGYYSLQGQYYKNTYPQRQFLGLGVSFRAQAFRVRQNLFRFANDSFYLGLHDGNTNGLYNEAEEDALVLAEADTAVFSTRPEDGAIELSEKSEYRFVLRGRTYTVSVISPFADSLQVTCLAKGQAYGLQPGQRLPAFAFKTTTRKKINTRSFRFRHTVVHFFNFENPSLGQDTAALNTLVAHRGRRLKVIGLYHGPQPEFLKNYVQYGKVKWVTAYASKEIMHKCLVEQLPTTYYLGWFRRVKWAGTAVTPLLNKLQYPD